jgi:hypothetical protein
MQMRMRCGGGIGWLVLILFMVTSSTASALTLADLDLGLTTSFTSLDGSLEFSEFQDITAGGGLNSNLANYTVVQLDGGFRIVGPIAVAGGDTGALSLSYKVSAVLPAQLMDGAYVFFNGAAFGDDAFADLTSNLLGSMGGSAIPGDGVLNLLVTGDGTKIKVDSSIFDPILEFFVDDVVVRVDSAGALAATVSAVDQRFSLVPEPTTGLMLGLGLFGLAAVGRRRPVPSEK